MLLSGDVVTFSHLLHNFWCNHIELDLFVRYLLQLTTARSTQHRSITSHLPQRIKGELVDRTHTDCLCWRKAANFSILHTYVGLEFHLFDLKTIVLCAAAEETLFYLQQSSAPHVCIWPVKFLTSSTDTCTWSENIIWITSPLLHPSRHAWLVVNTHSSTFSDCSCGYSSIIMRGFHWSLLFYNSQSLHT